MSAEQLNGLAAVMVGSGVALFFAGLWWRRRGRAIDGRLRVFVTTGVSRAVAGPAPSGGAALGSAPSFGQGLQRRLLRSSYGAFVRARIDRAGLGSKVWQIILVQAGLGLCFGLVGLLLAPAAEARALTGAALGAAGAAAPLVWLARRAAGRLKAFESQLPPAIDAMAATLQAGSSLQQAMAILSRELSPPIAVEFQRVLREVELGLTFPDSLNALSDRVPSGDLVIFTSAVSIQQRVGGDLVHIFRVISDTIRERLRIRGETRVLTSQGRYSAYVVGGLPVALFAFMWLTNYEYLSGLLQPGLPRLLLVAGTVGMALGFYLMNRIASVEV